MKGEGRGLDLRIATRARNTIRAAPNRCWRPRNSSRPIGLPAPVRYPIIYFLNNSIASFSFFFLFLLNYRQYARKFRENPSKSLLFPFFLGSFFTFPFLFKEYRVFFIILSFQVNTINYYYREIILTVISTLLFANPRTISRIILSKGENLLRAIPFFTFHCEKCNYDSKDRFLVNRYSVKARCKAHVPRLNSKLYSNKLRDNCQTFLQSTIYTISFRNIISSRNENIEFFPPSPSPFNENFPFHFLLSRSKEILATTSISYFQVYSTSTS